VLKSTKKTCKVVQMCGHSFFGGQRIYVTGLCWRLLGTDIVDDADDVISAR